MSMQRSIARNIARNRLIDAGYERPNKRMSITAQGGAGKRQMDEKFHRGRKNSRRRRAFLESLRRLDPPTWRRVFSGDISKKFAENQKKVWFKRGLANQEKRVHKQRMRQLMQMRKEQRQLAGAGEAR